MVHKKLTINNNDQSVNDKGNIVVDKCMEVATSSHENPLKAGGCERNDDILSSNNSDEVAMTAIQKNDGVVTNEAAKKQEASRTLDVDVIVPVPPDGGYGWVIVFAAFACSFVVDGIATAFAPFIDEYTVKFRASIATIGIIGSSLIGACLIVGPLASGLVNRFGVRIVAIFGSILAGLGFVASIFAIDPITMILSYGIVAGAGLGLIYLPAMVIVCFYFEKKRSIAVGLAVAGSGAGTIVMPPLNTFLIKNIGSSWTLAVLSGLSFLCVFFSYLFRPLSTKTPIKTDNDTYKLNSEQHITSVDAEDDNCMPEDAKQELTPDKKINPNLVDMDRNIQRLRAASECANFNFNYFRARTADRGSAFSKSFSYGAGKRRRISVLEFANSGHANCRFRASTISEFAKPMSRTDIFYHGSIKNLPEFVNDGENYQVYRARHVSFPATSCEAIHEIEEKVAEEQMSSSAKEKKWKCLPGSLKSVFAEMVDISLLKEPAMLLFCLSNILAMLGFYVPFMFIRNMGHEKKVSPNDTEWLLSILGIFNTIGRVAFGWLADRGILSPLSLNNLSLVVSGVLTFACPFYVSYHTLLAYSIFYGFIISAYICLTTINLTNLLGLERLTNAFGMIIISRSIACFLGTPLAGFFYDVTKSYDASFWFAGVLILLGGLATCAIPLFTKQGGKVSDNGLKDGSV